MRLLLLNNNPAVSRLIKLSAEKAGHELDEFDDYGLVPLHDYDVILVDNELYDETALAELKENIGCDYCLYICQRGAQKPDSVNVSLEKPFLPTDFLVLLEKVAQVLNSQKEEESSSVDEIEEENKRFDIDDIDTLEADESLKFDNVKFEDDLLDEAIAMDEALEKGDFLKETSCVDEKSFEDVDFEAENEEEETLLDEVPPCVLDKDDINEVKQLLDENDEEELEPSALDILDDLSEEASQKEESTALDEETLDEAFLESMDEKPEEEESLEWKLPESLDEDSEDNALEGLLENDLSLALDPSPFDFEEEEREEVAAEEVAFHEEETEEEESFLDTLDEQEGELASLDDLDENLIKKAFGEPVEEQEQTPVRTTKKEEIEVIRGEMEKSISRSISGLVQSDILREALKGMRINISISFDENEAK
ncbi:hypothetical protein [Sulfurospirillum barnesii]|uniref:Highly acidic protein n=1 Tax=Sulfurospirillum barnesii (strain ATCC 700032 / DSM 10660 / SES-3) TaxID=760154 RepID=I3XUZ9_SULBS|nr:hypothetical protein [Sulfurospirillum barnesii]AFL67773.1 hypothetical protein Sulba_0455 [Sulfurospirillum barnesii SES-3]